MFRQADGLFQTARINRLEKLEMKILLVAVLCLISALTLLSQARPGPEMTDLGDLKRDPADRLIA